MTVHNGLENMWGTVIVQVFIAGLSTQIPAFVVHKVPTGFFPSTSGFPVSIMLHNLENIIHAEQIGMTSK